MVFLTRVVWLLGRLNGRCDRRRLRTMNGAGEELEDNSENRQSDNKNNAATMAIMGRKSISGSRRIELFALCSLSPSHDHHCLSFPCTSSTCIRAFSPYYHSFGPQPLVRWTFQTFFSSVSDNRAIAAQSVSVVCVAGQCLEGYTNITRKFLC